MMLEFEDQYSKKNWSKVPPDSLFKSNSSKKYHLITIVAKINKFVDPEKENLAQNLTNLSRSSQGLILWLDCDREGEAIAYEVLEICQSVNPRLQVFRAQFSAFTKRDIENAMITLREPDPNLAAVLYSDLI
jgi:DNA topoisomerase-3